MGRNITNGAPPRSTKTGEWVSDYPECVENSSVYGGMGDTKFPECVATSHLRNPTMSGHGNESQQHQQTYHGKRRAHGKRRKLVEGSSTSLYESKTVVITESWGTRNSLQVSPSHQRSSLWGDRLPEMSQKVSDLVTRNTAPVESDMVSTRETDRIATLKPRGNGPRREHIP